MSLKQGKGRREEGIERGEGPGYRFRGEGDYGAGRALSAMVTFYSRKRLGLREGD